MEGDAANRGPSLCVDSRACEIHFSIARSLTLCLVRSYRHMMRFIRIASAAAIVALAFQLMADSRKVLKIAIIASGQITADGRLTTIEALIPILRELAKEKGEVWYYREAPETEAHPNAMKVLSAIVDQNLPVRLSSKPDYSDSIDDKGRSVPH